MREGGSEIGNGFGESVLRFGSEKAWDGLARVKGRADEAEPAHR